MNKIQKKFFFYDGFIGTKINIANKKAIHGTACLALLWPANITPVVVYSNIETHKVLLLKDNKGKSGIYCWRNLNNGKMYIGSSINLSKRFSQYLSIKFLNKELVNGKSKIYSALLKYSYSNFSLTIL